MKGKKKERTKEKRQIDGYLALSYKDETNKKYYKRVKPIKIINPSRKL